jgi:hypothetical protein
MGLDMYLEAEFYVSEYFKGSEDIREDLSKLRLNARLKNKPIKKLIVEVGYWRKANQIHQWFVDHVQHGIDDCIRSYVPREMLERLLSIINEILQEPKLAEELLPSRSGFFFGSTEYDEYYMGDLHDTKIILEDILNNEEYENWSFYYQSSW